MLINGLGCQSKQTFIQKHVLEGTEQKIKKRIPAVNLLFCPNYVLYPKVQYKKRTNYVPGYWVLHFIGYSV
jgi:hypothetical protein